MRTRRDILENLVAELIARFIIGAVIGGAMGLWLLPRFVRYGAGSLWYLLGCTIVVGLFSAIWGVRKGPGPI